ncbi:MAG: hypothetical protein IKB34_06610 [Clostridia bacterium]|nr:hypothetical protein [Clostridia bacterium]
MEIDLFSLPRRAVSALPPFPEFLSKLAAAEPVYAIKKARLGVPAVEQIRQLYSPLASDMHKCVICPSDVICALRVDF